MNSHRQRARRKTVTWQAISLALMAGAIGVGLLPIANMLGPRKYAPPKEVVVNTGPSKPESMTGGRVVRLTDVMNKIAGAVEVAPPPPVEIAVDPGTEPPPPPPPPAPDTSWVYVGSMGRGTSRVAIIDIAGQPQHTLAEGETIENTRLVKIEPNRITISVGGEERQINIASRPSWNVDAPRRGGIGGSATAARNMPGMSGMPGGPGMPGNPAAQGMNPNQAAMAEAQRRMKAAIAPVPAPQPIQEDRMMRLTRMAKEMGEIGPDKREALQKIVEDPSLSPEERNTMLLEIGIPIDATPDERGEFLEMIGISSQNDPKLHETLRNGGSK